MLADGILPALKKIAGPPISRSALYMWAKDYKRLKPRNEMVDR